MTSAIDLAIAKLDSLLKDVKATDPTPQSVGVASTSTAEPLSSAKTAPASSQPIADTEVDIDLFSKAQLRVAQILSVDIVENSAKLYVCQVDIGAGEKRQVLTGLQQLVPREELLGRLAVVIINLKPAKLAGQKSEAMILAGDTQTAAGEVVKLLVPPEGAEVGTPVFLEGTPLPAAYPKECKSDHWKKIVPKLLVQGGLATFSGAALAAHPGGPITVPGIPDGGSIH